MGALGPTLSRTSSLSGKERCENGSEDDPSPHRVVALIGDRRIRVDSRASNNARINVIAEAQHGCVGRGQLLGAGLDPGVIKRRVRSGRLDRVHAGVYRLPQTAGLPLAAETAALLACGHGVVLSHHSAATQWGLRPGTARPIHVTVIGSRGFPTPEGVRVHRSRTLTSSDIAIRQSLPVTSPARTLLDTAARLTDRDVERLLDEGLFALRILTLKDINDVLSRAGAHAGRARLSRVAANHTRSTKTDSPPEERLLRLIRAGGLPEPRTQFPVLGYRLDFFWPRLRLAVEVDAYGTHGSRTRFESDRRRDARLLAEQGIVVIRLTAAAIEERPFEVVGLLARALGQREAAVGA